MMPSPESASGQTRRRSSQGDVHVRVCCIDRTNAVQCDLNHDDLIIISGAPLGCGLRVSLVASCMAACVFVWWRKRVCSTVMFTMYVLHATRAFVPSAPVCFTVELDDRVSYIDK